MRILSMIWLWIVFFGGDPADGEGYPTLTVDKPYGRISNTNLDKPYGSQLFYKPPMYRYREKERENQKGY